MFLRPSVDILDGRRVAEKSRNVSDGPHVRRGDDPMFYTLH
jgi:hypothetical protein